MPSGRTAASQRLTLSRPRIGRSAACFTPPPSVISTTSGARTSSRRLHVAGDRGLQEPRDHLVVLRWV